MIRWLCLLTILASPLTAEVAQINKAESLPATTPWDLSALSEVPEAKWQEQGEVRALHYRGEPFEGKPTRVFAYYATPGTLAGDSTKDRNLPGIVLVHGGGGRAFELWARLWASRGYAAIAMDLSGRGQDRKRLADGGPGQADDTKFGDGPIEDQWSYHAVANVIRAHSLLLSRPEVDARRTAITGISWGGYLTCIVAGLDDRFQAAVPVYGCGFLGDNSAWLGRFAKMEPRQKQHWLRLWDPSQYLGSARMPMLFVNGGTDFAYPPDSHARSYALVESPKALHFVPRLKHGHIFDRPKVIEAFVDHHLKGGPELPRIGRAQRGGDGVRAQAGGPNLLTKAQLHYTRHTLSHPQRQWMSVDAEITADEIRAPLPPKDAVIWFLSVEDERGLTVSSPLVLPGLAGPVPR